MSGAIGDVAAYSTEQKLAEVANKASVGVFKGALESKEAVVAKLLEGAAAVQNVRAPEQSGQNLNIRA